MAKTKKNNPILIGLPKFPKEIKHFCANPGEKEKITYKYVYDEKYGCPMRVESGKIDILDYIQQSADDVDFKSIGKMLVDTRDNVIDHFQMEGETFDVTRLPRNIHEYEALHNKMLAEFDKLPADMKALFGNDFGQFSKSWQTGTIGSVLDTYYKGVAGSGEGQPAPAPEGDK